MKEKKTKQFESGRKGSALIMTMVLTVLLAIIAVMFVAVARMDRAATSNIADNKMLESAAKSITEIISTDLINDTPGVTHDRDKYYDYPDPCNTWLASLEPFDSGSGVYKWRQISDVNGYLKRKGFSTNNVGVKPFGLSTTVYVRDYPEFKVDSDGRFLNTDGITLSTAGISADADGDGIADSKWIDLGMRSSKGQRIFAAVRVIDNSAMININTAYSFDANSLVSTKIDGSDQMQINLDPNGLLKTGDKIATLHKVRCGKEDSNDAGLTKYKTDVIWNFSSVPDGNYLPFGISDELELRYRYCIDSKFVSRFEDKLPHTPEAIGWRNFGHLYDGKDTDWQLGDWQSRITNFNDTNADRRHLLTAYNLDRIIDPCGQMMANINDANANILYNRIHAVISNANTAAQIAVNIKDYRDSDSNVTALDVNGTTVYGFEQPCVYISELAYNKDSSSGTVCRSYAIELYKPYAADPDPNASWQIVVNNPANPLVTVNIAWPTSSQYHVIKWENSGAPLPVVPFQQDKGNPTNNIIFDVGSTISLTRKVGGVDVVVDSVIVPANWPLPTAPDGTYSIQRDTEPNKCIRRLWDPTLPPLGSGPLTLGGSNNYHSTDPCIVIAHPADTSFNNVGEIGMIFTKPAYYKLGGSNTGVIGYNGTNNTDSQVRLNLVDPNYQRIFNYLTVWPRSGSDERIKGRININTAPAFVIAQLPWVAHRKGYYDPNLAKAIVVYRDNTAKGFKSIGQLMNVPGIDFYKDANSLTGFPHLPSAVDYYNDKFANRDLLFARISDLVTVRSDIFTAYMLVRISTDGPQKRYMVILDRSGVTSANRKVKVIVFQPVAEAR
jgi:hypothetical protein